MLGRAAEDHLAQAALRVGALDQQIRALRSRFCENDLARASSASADCFLGRSDAMGFQVCERVLGAGTRVNTAFYGQQHNALGHKMGIAMEIARHTSVLAFQ